VPIERSRGKKGHGREVEAEVEREKRGEIIIITDHVATERS